MAAKQAVKMVLLDSDCRMALGSMKVGAALQPDAAMSTFQCMLWQPRQHKASSSLQSELSVDFVLLSVLVTVLTSCCCRAQHVMPRRPHRLAQAQGYKR